MAAKSPVKASQDQQLVGDMLIMADHPITFVKYAFPWGKAGTPLEGIAGPRKWQLEELDALTDYLHAGRASMANGVLPPMYKSATAAGRGIGKSALTSWIVLWMMSTKLGSTSIVTANSQAQLHNRTWAELGRWLAMSRNSHWFEITAESLKPAEWFAKLIEEQLKISPKYWYAQADLWREERPDAFAGAHNPLGELYIFDEASGIPTPIWGVAEGMFTEKILERFWFAFGNPRRNTGSFYECFHGESRKFWRHKTIDARTVEETEKGVYEAIIAQHGPESYNAFVEVYGEFPPQGEKQFISRDVIKGAVERDLTTDDHAGLVMGVDVARFGSDDTMIVFRRGRDARSIPAIRISKFSIPDVVDACAAAALKYNPDAIVVDGDGIGGAVVDYLQRQKFRVHEMRGNHKPVDDVWANKRTEVWARLRDWLPGGCLPDDKDLQSDLAAPEYRFMAGSEKIRLETKDEMKARQLASPDHGDALAYTFAVQVARSDMRASSRNSNRSRRAKGVDYDPLA